MHYFVDGYNLLFRIIRGNQSLLAKRQHIISDLNEKIQQLNLNVTIVFDGTYQVGEMTRSHFNYLEIIFTSTGESADDYIISAVGKSSKPQQEIVITSDKRLAWHIRRLGAKTESIDEFQEWLNKRYKNRQTSTTKPRHPLTKQSAKKPRVAFSDSAQQKSSIEECYEYYLEAFQKEFDTFSDTKSHQKKQKLTDFQRWLNAFERPLDDNDK